MLKTIFFSCCSNVSMPYFCRNCFLMLTLKLYFTATVMSVDVNNIISDLILKVSLATRKTTSKYYIWIKNIYRFKYCVSKISQKVFNQSTSWFVEAFGFWEKSPWSKGVCVQNFGRMIRDMRKISSGYITAKWWEIDMWSLVGTNRKSFKGVQLHHYFDLQRPWRVKVKVTQISEPYIS